MHPKNNVFQVAARKWNALSYRALATAASAVLPVLCCCLILFAVACSDSGDSSDDVSARRWSNLDILAIAPDHTSWALAVDLQVSGNDELKSGIDEILSAQPKKDPLFTAVASVLDKATAGLEPTEDFSNFTLNYLLTPEPSLLLLADSYQNTLQALFGSDSLAYMQQHLGVTLYSHSISNNVVAMLPGALLCIGGSASAVIAAIDQYHDAEDRDESALTQALAAEIEKEPIAFALQLAKAPTSELQPGEIPSLDSAELLSGALRLTAGELSGSARFIMQGADIFSERFNLITNDSYNGKITAPEPDMLEVDVSVGVNDFFDRFLLKQLSFGMDGIDYAKHTGVGKNLPWLTFSVQDNPGSIFINYRFISTEKRLAFEREVLPHGFKLTPLRILAGEAPQYYLVLNIYGSSGGLVEGARAEWSVFVQDPQSGEPRFLVVEAVAASLAADPVNLLTFPEPVEHRYKGANVQSYVGRINANGSESTYFRSSFEWPQPTVSTQKLAVEFAVANDAIYWGNAVADRGVYNGSVHNRDMAVIDLDSFQQENNSKWAQYLAPIPQHVLSYTDPLELVISPWANLEADYLDVTDAHLQNLINFSNGFYPMTAATQALAGFSGIGDVTRPQYEASELPSVYFHFPIIDAAGMIAALAEANVQQLAKVALAAGGTPGHYLTLQLYAYEADACGLRADWLTYRENPETGLAESLYLERTSSQGCIDVETLFRPPSQVKHTLKSGRSYLSVNSLNTRFAASADPAFATNKTSDPSLVAAGDEQCALAGFCDRHFYDGDTLLATLMEVDASATDITSMETPWNSFISTQPTAVIFRNSSRLLLTMPWSNVTPADNRSDKKNPDS